MTRTKTRHATDVINNDNDNDNDDDDDSDNDDNRYLYSACPDLF